MESAIEQTSDSYPFTQCVKNLEAELRDLHEFQKSYEDRLVVKDLEDSDIYLELSEIEEAEIEGFQRSVEKLMTKYTKVMREYPTEAGTGINFSSEGEDNLNYIREFDRMIKYSLKGVNFWEILDDEDHPIHQLSCDCTRRARILIAGRVSWIEKQLREGKDPYPTKGRYANLITNPESLRNSLSGIRKWLIDWAIPPTFELHILMTRFWELDTRINMMRLWVSKLAEKGPDVKILVDDISVEWTEKAMCSKNNTCDICMFTFDLEFNDEELTEPAVRTMCGHVLGKVCLQTWAETHNTCPKCRKALFEFVKFLPLAAQPLYHEMKSIRGEMMQLDKEIDAYFLHEPLEVYGHPLETTFKKLNKLWKKTYTTERAMHKLVHGTPLE